MEISFDIVRAGRLGKAEVDKLYALDKEKQRGRSSKTADKNEAAKPLPIIVSLVSLRHARTTAGLLLLPASLSPEGVLSADPEESEPWVPASRLRAQGAEDREVMVGDLTALWNWRMGRGRELLSRIGSWGDAVEYTLELFRSIADEDSMREEVEAAGAELLTDTCFVSVGEQMTPNGAILDLYADLLRRDAHAPVYESLLSSQVPRRQPSEGLDQDLRDLAASAQASVGSMSDEFPLTDSQRRAVHAFLRDGDGSITAVSGPPGTGKTTLLQSVVASLIVQRALHEESAPLIVGTSTNNQAVTNILDSFNSVTKEDPGILDQRWLLGATEDGAEEKPLRGLAAYCPSQRMVEAAKKKGYLLEDTRKGGVYTRYSAPAYVPQAITHLMAQARSYCGAIGIQPPSTLEGMASVLRKTLQGCDQSRRDLIDARARADATVGQSSAEVSQEKDSIAAQLVHAQQREQYWRERLEEVAAAGGISTEKDAYFAEMGRAPGEPQLNSCAEYVTYHEDRRADLGQSLDRVVGELSAATQQERAAHEAFTRDARKALFRAQMLGQLTDEQVEKLAAASCLADLDKALDVTLRYAAFWLAVHVYEAEWLLAAHGDGLIKPEDRQRTSGPVMEQYWSQATALTPMFVMTAYKLPQFFQLWAKEGEPRPFDLGRIDLLIVDEAGQVDTSVGAAGFALARRALVVGDVQQLAPVWSIDPESDRVMGESFGLVNWPAVQQHGLTASNHSSIMKAASAASGWTYGADADPGLFLSEHFRCHAGIIGFCNELLYKGLLKPSRPAAPYKLDGLVPRPFLFKEVVGSKDQRRGSSRVNEREAADIAAWVADNYEYFRAIYNPDHVPDKDRTIIGVVTPFAAQAGLITRRLEAAGSELAKSVTVGTAHTLQGAERSVVLFSAVYGNESPKASFIDGTLELMNVAVSRAKDLFIVFGAHKRWSDTGPVFSLVRKYAERHECAFAVPASGASHAASASPDIAVVEGAPSVRVAGSSKVERRAPGYVIAKDMIARWSETQALGGVKVTAAKLNQALEGAGLIHRSAAGPMPTDAGVALGIRHYEGTGKDGAFVNLIYGPTAQSRLAEMIKAGKLEV